MFTIIISKSNSCATSASVYSVYMYVHNCVCVDNCILLDMDSTVESTGITPRLDQMVEQLCAEDEEKDPRDPGTMVRK